MRMAMIAVWIKGEGKGVAPALQEAAEKVSSADELVVDLAAVRRIDVEGLRAMEGLVNAAEEKRVKVVLRGVNVEIYKVLKLTKLAPRFSFESGDSGRERS